MEPDGSIETSPGLEREGRALLGAMATVATAIALSGVVVSLFFFTRGRGPLTLTLQFLGTYVGMTIGSAVAGRLWRWGPTPLVRLSLFLFAAYYGALVLLGPRAAHLPVVLGAVGGAASGMYWFATNALTYDLIAPRQRSTFYGANGALGGIVGVVMPLLAGEAITRVGHGAGYRAVFATALVLYAVAFQVTRSLPDGHPVGGTTLSASLGLVATSRRWRSAWAGTAAASGFTAIWPVVAVSLAYAATDSAAAVALCTSVAAMAGALAAYALRSTTRISPAGGAQAALAMVAAAASLAWPGGGYPLLLAYGAVSAVAFAAIDLAMFRAMLEGIDAARDGRHSRSVHVLGMELAWGVGRVVSLALLALALLRWPGHAALVAAAIVSAFVQVPAAWWLHRAGAVSGAT